MVSFLRRFKRSQKVDKNEFIIKNGKILLQKLIACSNGKRNPIFSYSCRELSIATNHYDRRQVITTGAGYRLYKGFLHDRAISVMNFEDFDYAKEFCFNNIVFASQMCHKNLLRLSGCCLDNRTPILVFEFVEYGTLSDHIYQSHFEPLQLRDRLKIAMEIANAIAYLHVGFARPILFRDIEPLKILFDENKVPKLFNFSLCESIPEDETHIRGELAGTMGFVAPEYITTNDCNEKCNVYSFGVSLLVLLTGQRVFYPSEDPNAGGEDFYLSDHVKKYFENDRLIEIVDPIIVGEELSPVKEQQL
ncbi:non-functional pseudokinase ZED1-like [Pistacia vera]|uniref:non-functional pseudokinase ZED1-like n=1 Tax=Pistacia vera TaxID=55513 RepID=UPI0012632E27|nr:non-functional pseudokinase ZED1-like [Pistacia vera]